MRDMAACWYGLGLIPMRRMGTVHGVCRYREVRSDADALEALVKVRRRP
jgi:hypothetical protein